MPICCRLAGFYLFYVLEIAAVRKTNGKIEALGFAIEMFIVRVRVDSAENCVSRFAFPAAGARDSAYLKHVAGRGAFLNAGRVTGNYWKRRLVYAAGLAVS